MSAQTEPTDGDSSMRSSWIDELSKSNKPISFLINDSRRQSTMLPMHGSDARVEPRSLLPWDYQPVKSRKEREDPHTYINGKKFLILEDGEAIEVNWGRPGPDPKYPAPEIVPNLIKKTRGRQAPTADQSLRSDTYACKVTGCGKVFNRAHHLRRHMRSIHTYETPWQCAEPNCGRKFSREDNLKRHEQTHTSWLFTEDSESMKKLLQDPRPKTVRTKESTPTLTANDGMTLPNATPTQNIDADTNSTQSSASLSFSTEHDVSDAVSENGPPAVDAPPHVSTSEIGVFHIPVSNVPRGPSLAIPECRFLYPPPDIRHYGDVSDIYYKI